MRRLLLKTITTGLILACAGANGSEQRTSLLNIYEEAKRQAPNMLITEYSAEMAGLREREALGQLLPQVSLDSQINRTDYSSDTTSYGYTGERHSLTLSQPIYDSERYQSWKRSKYEAEQYQYQTRFDLQQETFNLVQTYFQVLQEQSRVDLINEELKAVEKNADKTTALYERKLASLVQKLDVDARADKLRSDLVQAGSNLDTARDTLAEFVGSLAYQPLFELTPDADLDQITVDGYAQWLDAAQLESPLLRAKRAALQASEANLARNEAGHLPKLSVQLQAQQTNIGSNNSLSNSSDSAVASLRLTVPLYMGGSVTARSDAAAMNVEIAKQELEAAKRQVAKEIRSALTTINAMRSAIDAAEVAFKSASTAREAGEKTFKFGISDAVQVTERIAAQFEAEQSLLNARYQLLTSYIALLFWSGQLGDGHIEMIDRFLG